MKMRKMETPFPNLPPYEGERLGLGVLLTNPEARSGVMASDAGATGWCLILLQGRPFPASRFPRFGGIFLARWPE